MSDFTFSPYQIAEMAMQIEDEGARFYILLSNLTDSQKLKEIFSSLSKAEMNHKKKFHEIADANRKEPAEYSINLQMVMKTHMDKIAETSFKIKSKASLPQTVLNALNMAIDIEKRSIEIYTEIKEASIELFSSMLTSIISEEEKHLKIIEEIKEGLV